MTIKIIAPIILALISGTLGYYLRYRIDKTKEINSKVTDERREHYQKFVNIVVDILKSSSQKTKLNNNKVMDDLHNFYKKYLVYASPKVITAFGNYFQFLYHENQDEELDGKIKTKTHFQLLAKIVMQMREDLGLSNKNLGKYGEKIFRATISDIDEYF